MEYYVGLDVSLKQIQAEGIEHIAAYHLARPFLRNSPNGTQPKFHAARKDRSGAAGPRATRRRDRMLT